MKSRSIVRNCFLGYRTQTSAAEEDPAEAREALSNANANANAVHIGTFYFHPWTCFHTLAHSVMACIPLSFPPSAVTPKLEPEATPAPSRATAWNLPNLGPHPTSRPSKSGVQKKRQQFSLPHRPKGSLAHLSSEEQIKELRQSRKAIKSKLYSKIARLQVGAARLMPLVTPLLICSKAGVRCSAAGILRRPT